MDQLHPVSFGTTTVRSYSAGSYGSSTGSASSSTSMQDTAAAAVHTPSTSPSLSDRSTYSSQPSSNWNKLPSRAHQPSSFDSPAGPTSGLSPLELLVKRGMQVQQDIFTPDDVGDKADTSTNRILERASALSRKTSVRKPPIQPSPDPDDFDDAQSIRSVNLLSDAGSSFSRGQRGSAASSAVSSPNPGSSFSVQRGYKASYDDSTDSYTPTQPQSDWQRQSSHLLSNAFRNSVASDISFNSITPDDLDSSSLSRRASIDTVRSSEFGEHGRWGRAWTSRAEDEESLYGESAYGDEYDPDQNGDSSNAIDAHIDLDPTRGPFSSNLGLDTVARQWKLDHAPHLASAGYKAQTRNTRSNVSAAASIPAIREVASQEKIVSLTRSVPPATTMSRLQQTAVSPVADPRHSFVPQIVSHDYDAPPHHSQLYDRTPMASADRYLGHRSTPSTATITGDNKRADCDSPPTARVYVYPPSPSGSEAAAVPSGAAQHHNTTLPLTAQQRYGSMPSPTSAQIENMAAAVPQKITNRETQRMPLAPSSLLSNTRSVSAGSAKSQRLRSSGHPAGRVPPPPPPARSGSGDERSPLGYSDPNQYFQGVDQPIIGRKRAEAIARADGRESMVSDLDVETLRLDGSSRRDSSSTIGSVITSRMSIGSVSHGTTTMQTAAAWRNSQSAVSPKPSQSSFRSLQSVQDTAAGENAARPPMLRNAKSATTIPSGPPGSIAMQPTASAPPTGLGVGLGGGLNGAAAKPRTSPAVDTRTGPSTAEDFLSQGITYHEQGDLARSAFYFERSAKVDGGCVVGMCMFGMALREGWGARKDPVKGFTWIQRAAARAGEMMSTTAAPKTDSELKAIKSELKLSVYELGKCFCYGWGVKMDKHMALEYFELAAKLGDADAQAEAGALYAVGKGCKKDLKKAAMYYRMAEAGGYDTVGLSWIHKDKYK
ncbi:hypothetical protein EX895_002898 [Sporisorium graminicola]|uniref:HCP-like protein n=1 Tax=Sporisorium graminicola TaxID=280036 RepID=A0A4U7KXR2_9BASI|nr:hypothetical protein EX895_002898 [Sporisorium graminicola]TKY88188.1 hypothetical protein EX895_002898 [Sporisorium graminicola]